MSVLVDTSVWVEHFRNPNDALMALLDMDEVLLHPMVLAELACGTPPAPRTQTLHDLGLLQSCNAASFEEVMAFIEQERLYGLGCGIVDIVLLASTLITPGAALWTLDKDLGELAKRFGIGYPPTTH